MPIQGPIPLPPRRKRHGRSVPLWPFCLAAAVLFLPPLVLGVLFGWAATHWQMLVEDTPGAHARWAVTLAGEGGGEADRTEKAIELLREHRVDSILSSGTPVIANTYMSSIILAGEPLSSEEREHFLEARHSSSSTLEEARTLVPALRSLGVDTVLLVTSSFHTRRAAAIFRAVAKGHPVVLPVAANWGHFKEGWKDREGAKAWLTEWTKTLWWTFVDRRSNDSLRTDAVQIVRYPEAGKIGAACPVCPTPKPCPEPHPAPKAPDSRKVDSPKKTVPQEHKDARKPHESSKDKKAKTTSKDEASTHKSKDKKR